MKATDTMAARLSVFLLGTLVVLAPLFRSGKVPLATMTLELLAVLAFLVLWWDGAQRPGLPRIEKLLLGALALLPLIQLVPLPGLSRADLPGQADYFVALGAAGV
jgi:hypothetical protein